MKRTLIALIALMIAAALTLPALAEQNPMIGQTLPDFTVDTIDGGSFTLSEALKDHDIALITCGPPGARLAAANFPACRRPTSSTATAWR